MCSSADDGRGKPCATAAGNSYPRTRRGTVRRRHSNHRPGVVLIDADRGSPGTGAALVRGAARVRAVLPTNVMARAVARVDTTVPRGVEHSHLSVNLRVTSRRVGCARQDGCYPRCPSRSSARCGPPARQTACHQRDRPPDGCCWRHVYAVREVAERRQPRCGRRVGASTGCAGHRITAEIPHGVAHSGY